MSCHSWDRDYLTSYKLFTRKQENHNFHFPLTIRFLYQKWLISFNKEFFELNYNFLSQMLVLIVWGCFQQKKKEGSCFNHKIVCTVQTKLSTIIFPSLSFKKKDWGETFWKYQQLLGCSKYSIKTICERNTSRWYKEENKEFANARLLD